ncbi:DUF4221 family protein [Roseivirga sp. UBA1976]|uniref:DUF4221 family protein n=1 Tax=Roseivirga sp. UBA1976 TaxID=1947386 RepID=UPI00257C3B36|nr:DUF4221 family protein [Roseivirga sp. UBA1976]MEC7754997.1 DUF4221 family protein [Bacteroidota bacterium]|tara:strand:+ start:2720 stop:3901 length:1182 start_codon:yes stop_codon:yes gene_type:complete
MKNIPFILLLVFCFSCTENQGSKKTIIKYNSTLVKSDSLSLNLDSQTSYEFFNVVYFENDSIEVLFNINSSINGFNVYDLNTANLISQVSIPFDGPFSVRDIQGITVKSLDSIYIFGKRELRKIAVIDYLGNFKRQFSSNHIIKLDGTSEEILFINHQSITSAPTILFDNKLFFTKYGLFNYYFKTNINSSYSEEFFLDLNSFELKELPIGFPKWLLGKSMHMYKMTNKKTINNNGEIVFALAGGDSIRVFNPKDYSFKAYFAKYDQDNKEDEFYSKQPSQDKALEDGLGSYIYTQLIYDKYRNVYYRILERPIRYDPNIHKNYFSYYYKPVSCVILNSKFDKIGEFDFEEDVHRAYGLFVGRKGLYVPKLHANYKNLSEDRVEYSIYSLVSK